MTPPVIRYLWKLFTLIPFLLTRQLTRLFPRDHKRICIGAWFGDLYADNSKYLVEYLLKNTDYKITWIAKEKVKSHIPCDPKLRFVRKGSPLAVWALLRAKYWISCIGHIFDLTSLPIDGGAICVNLWHGIPLKNLGQNSIWDKNSTSGKGLRARLERIYSHLTGGTHEWALVASLKMGDILYQGFPNIFSRDRFLRIGSPRNDYLVINKRNASLTKALRNKYSKILNTDPNSKIVLYLPTWRISGKNVFCFYELPKREQQNLQRELRQLNAVLIEKHHFHTYEQHPVPSESMCSVPVRPEQLQQIDAQELLLAADILISDYSGAYIDFGLLERPCIHFAYDLKEYSENDSGLAYDIEKSSAGPVATTYEELKSLLFEQLKNPRANPGPQFHEIVEFETGNSCQQLVKFLATV